jgi:PBSX family phage terminase large subunit
MIPNYGVTEVFVKHDYYCELKIKVLRKDNNDYFLCQDNGECLVDLYKFNTKKKIRPIPVGFFTYELKGDYYFIYEDGEYSIYRYKYIKHVGSSRSSKSFSLEEKAIRECEIKNSFRFTVWRDTRESLGNSVWKDFRKIFSLSGREYKFPRNTVPIYFDNGSIIEPHGDDTTNAHGITQDKAWLNEPYKMSKETFNQIDQRANQIWIDINPSIKHWSDDLDSHPRCKVIHSTFLLNPFCPIEQKRKILSYDPRNPVNVSNETADAYMWSVYGLGLKAEKPNRIFKNWKVIDNIEFDNLKFPSYYGMDFGLSAPTTLVEMKFDGDETFFFKELLYKPMNVMSGTLSDELHNLGIDKRKELIVDSGNEINKTEGNKLKNSGFNVIYALKGKGSVVSGIELLQKKQVYYTKQSTNLEQEYENHSWRVVQSVQLDEPEQGNDHAIDACKYVSSWFARTRYLT